MPEHTWRTFPGPTIPKHTTQTNTHVWITFIHAHPQTHTHTGTEPTTSTYILRTLTQSHAAPGILLHSWVLSRHVRDYGLNFCGLVIPRDLWAKICRQKLNTSFGQKLVNFGVKLCKWLHFHSPHSTLSWFLNHVYYAYESKTLTIPLERAAMKVGDWMSRINHNQPSTPFTCIHTFTLRYTRTKGSDGKGAVIEEREQRGWVWVEFILHKHFRAAQFAVGARYHDGFPMLNIVLVAPNKNLMSKLWMQTPSLWSRHPDKI